MHDVWPYGKYQRIEWRATRTIERQFHAFISVRLRHIYFSSLTIHNINIDGHGDTCRRAAVNIISCLKNIRSTAMTTSTTSSTMAFHQIKRREKYIFEIHIISSLAATSHASVCLRNVWKIRLGL